MQQQFQISGMNCEHCVMRVRNAFTGMNGVKSADVNLEAGTATVDADSELDLSAVAAAIEDAGYQLVTAG